MLSSVIGVRGYFDFSLEARCASMFINITLMSISRSASAVNASHAIILLFRSAMNDVSSSTVPYDSTRISYFLTRTPPISDVLPFVSPWYILFS